MGNAAAVRGRRPPLWAQWALTVYGFAYLIACLILLLPFGLLGTALYFTPARSAAMRFTYKLAQLWARSLMWLVFTRPRVRGLENIPRSGGVCFVANHQGIFDIVLLLAYAGRPFGFIAKKELALVPFMNCWILVLGGLFIDRRNPRKALKTIAAGVKHIERGGAMLIFPEGTRSRGRGLLPFRAGAFKLASKARSPIVPVAITGSYEYFEKEMRVTLCPVSVSFGKPIEWSEEARTQTAENARTAISELLAEAERATTPAT